MLIIKLASSQALLHLSMLTPPEPEIKNRPGVTPGSSLKPYCLNVGKRMHAFLFLSSTYSTKSFRHVGTKVLALTISHAGTSPGRRPLRSKPPPRLRRSWDIADTWLSEGLIFNFVLYNTQVQGFVPKKESPSNQRIHFQLGCFLSNPFCCQTLKKCATFDIIILPLQF